MASCLLASCLLCLAVLLSACQAPGSEPLRPADVVLLNGGIYTLVPSAPWAEAVAIEDGIIVAIGDNQTVESLVADSTRVVDLATRMALPGFHDAHVHPLSAGQALLGCALNQELDVASLLQKIEECADGMPYGEWVFGQDFDLSLFPGGNPNKAILDQVVPDRPVLLSASDGHNSWANSRALELAGITDQTPDPDLGVIERDAKGEPTGVLRETAQELVARLLPEPSEELKLEALAAALAEIHRAGITSFIDASVDEEHWRLYQALDARGELAARVVTSLTYGTFSGSTAEEFESSLARRASYESERLRTGAVKIFTDGVLEGRTAALIEPYSGSDRHRGTLNLEPEELAQAVTRFDAQGLQVHMHAIGDGAVRAALDAVEAARARNGASDNRHHIAHLQLIADSDLGRFSALDVTANFQALWAFPDPWITDINLPDVGQERVDRMYPIASVVRAQGRVVGGSDWSVSSVDPLQAIETAVRRQDPDGRVAGVLNAGERVDLATMIAAYTINAAWLMHQEDQVGSLEVGKRADIVVLDRNLFELEPEQIGDARVDLTIFDGRVIFDRTQSP